MPSAHPKSAFSIAEMKALWKSNRVSRVKGRNDRIEKNRGGVSYYLFGNQIAHYDPSTRTLLLRDSGFRTSTTKNRLNSLGANITQRDYTWYTTKNGRIMEWTGSKRIRV